MYLTTNMSHLETKAGQAAQPSKLWARCHTSPDASCLSQMFSTVSCSDCLNRRNDKPCTASYR